MSSRMTAETYQRTILAHAEDAAGAGELDNPDASVAIDNPVCGDRVTVDINVANGSVTALAHNVRGCVLCQAAASVVGAQAPGSNRDEIESVYAALLAMLEESTDAPGGKWAELSMFAPVQTQPHRRHCVLLPFEALRRALDAASTEQ